MTEPISGDAGEPRRLSRDKIFESLMRVTSEAAEADAIDAAELFPATGARGQGEFTAPSDASYRVLFIG